MASIYSMWPPPNSNSTCGEEEELGPAVKEEQQPGQRAQSSSSSGSGGGREEEQACGGSGASPATRAWGCSVAHLGMRRRLDPLGLGCRATGYAWEEWRRTILSPW
nr:unnamed protein product [Digitaria exilis]